MSERLASLRATMSQLPTRDSHPRVRTRSLTAKHSGASASALRKVVPTAGQVHDRRPGDRRTGDRSGAGGRPAYQLPRCTTSAKGRRSGLVIGVSGRPAG